MDHNFDNHPHGESSMWLGVAVGDEVLVMTAPPVAAVTYQAAVRVLGLRFRV